ncbi:hypothetical protein HCA39_13860 [Listeria seeligeri]|uniref:hypothetical protein n=2 Tax=Listeria seeligeri TaxID=1640 RepID=UPI001629EAE0|nr:hypothetical protein [Listeria seeligeri]MBC1423478.1 hypothetical protein [Listeria seeligeri]MBC1431040.1 hypothetical protein [Listeria seeligeri]MBC1527367.1 hypothetical protein [Listeria seeligeri]MBC1755760.1 hypothetical protein [Listeria seeligeri]MBC1775334.1 hypothetical protein [Listeria seeligeri]
MEKEMAEKTVTIQQLERQKQAMEDEIYQWKQRRYQLEEIESDLARLQLVEQKLIMLSSDAWSGNYGQSVAGNMEVQQLEQQRILKKEIHTLKEVSIQQESNTRKSVMQVEKEQQTLRKEVYQ